MNFAKVLLIKTSFFVIVKYNCDVTVQHKNLSVFMLQRPLYPLFIYLFIYLLRLYLVLKVSLFKVVTDSVFKKVEKGEKNP